MKLVPNPFFSAYYSLCVLQNNFLVNQFKISKIDCWTLHTSNILSIKIVSWQIIKKSALFSPSTIMISWSNLLTKILHEIFDFLYHHDYPHYNNDLIQCIRVCQLGNYQLNILLIQYLIWDGWMEKIERLFF
jgi:hypothetical protein